MDFRSDFDVGSVVEVDMLVESDITVVYLCSVEMLDVRNRPQLYTYSGSQWHSLILRLLITSLLLRHVRR